MTKEIIEKIEILDDYKFDVSHISEYEGYLLTTSEQKIFVVIESGQSCCEDAGYLSTLDDVNEFIGAELQKIRLTNKALNKVIENKMKDDYLEVDDCVFVDFITSKGKFQIVVYNSHNGYYGHDIKIISKQVNKEDCI